METWLCGIFASFALLVAMIGLYGLVNDEVNCVRGRLAYALSLVDALAGDKASIASCGMRGGTKQSRRSATVGLHRC